MRPVRLDLDGFASFRDPATVDFTDADYFTLVGPTGSGKSTVVDAMTFALYGSAPRWGSVSSIQYALAPTANRCTVRLVFDVGGQRYVVAREVRRSGTAIQQKSSVLERYLDPAASGDPAADEPTESLAGDPKAVRTQVIELLGLEFDDFCTCVVLPQGEFQKFLKAGVTERQNILLKLIGGKHYDAIGKLAGRRAADAGVRVEALDAQLRDYTDATEDSEAEARAREAELASLEPLVQAAVTSITALAARRAESLTLAGRTAGEIDTLAAVRAPAGVEELQTALTDAQTAYREASEYERVAAAAAGQADQAFQAGPQRTPLEEALRRREELAAGKARLQTVATAVRTAADAHSAAEVAARQAEGQLEEQREAHAAAHANRSAAAAAVDAVQRRIAALASVRVPPGVDDLAVATTQARTTREKADTDRGAVEAELAEVRLMIDDLPHRSALEELVRIIDDYETASTTGTRLETEQHELAEHTGAARATVAERAETWDAARETLEQLRTQSAAADLRPHLRVGEPCPVCDQAVATLPPRSAAPLLDAARASLADAEKSLAAARDEQHDLATRRATLDAELRASTSRASILDRTLAARLRQNPSGPDRDPAQDRTVQGILAQRVEDATRRQSDLGCRLIEARTSWETADLECDRLHAASEQARAALHAQLGRLATEAPPEVEAADLAVAWTALADWAATRSETLSDEDLAVATSGLQDAEARWAGTTRELAQAMADDKEAAEALTAAALTAQQAELELDQLTRRLDELENLLAGRPDPDELRRLLAVCERLETEARQARQAAQAAMAARQTAEDVREARRVAADRARTALRDAREPLVTFGVPALDHDDLALAWSDLVSWAAAEGERRRAQLIMLEIQASEVAGRLQRELRDLVAALTAHGIDIAAHKVSLDPVNADATQAARVPAVLMVECERARNRTAEVVRRRREAERLRRGIARDTETQQVAAELSRLMSSRRFPQWLADAALDTLVADASASLMRLSNNQFDLTHDRGEFFVIDHADADSARSVRTLSGGETFQASLALALALSEQLSTLAAGGRTRLDSIFLDEGFGTLDPDALEIVAGTLENLAQEDRMVGVITHVTALAERVPVRYELSRDSRTSSIERVGP